MPRALRSAWSASWKPGSRISMAIGEPSSFSPVRAGAILAGPFPRDNLGRRAGHEDRGPLGGPFQLEVAAREVGDQAAARPTRQGPGDADGAGPGAAGQGDPRAALPGAHPYLGRPQDLGEVDVDPPGERRMVL